jgi:hypothetical protein
MVRVEREYSIFQGGLEIERAQNFSSLDCVVSGPFDRCAGNGRATEDA